MMLINRGPSFYIQLNTMVLYCVKRKNFVFNPFFFWAFIVASKEDDIRTLMLSPFTNPQWIFIELLILLCIMKKSLCNNFFFFAASPLAQKQNHFFACLYSSVLRQFLYILVQFQLLSAEDLFYQEKGGGSVQRTFKVTTN